MNTLGMEYSARGGVARYTTDFLAQAFFVAGNLRNASLPRQVVVGAVRLVFEEPVAKYYRDLLSQGKFRLPGNSILPQTEFVVVTAFMQQKRRKGLR